MLEKMTKKELLEYAKEHSISDLNIKMAKADILEELKKYEKSISLNNKRNQIKNDLLDQLERDGVVGEFYVDLVNDYMAMWDVKNKLIADIECKGVSVRYQNGENQFGYKKNDSVAELQRTNNQMLKLLDHLGLKPSKSEGFFDPADLEM